MEKATYTKESPYLSRITWDEFRATGLLLFINQILHIFGLCIVCEITGDGNVFTVYPARTKFRGFPHSAVVEDIKKLTDYMAQHAEELKKECE